MDYQHCHDEQIHTPAHVQSYGYLIGIDPNTKSILFVSENIPPIFNIDHDVLGRNFEDEATGFNSITSSHIYRNLSPNLKEANKNLDKITIGETDFHLTIYLFKGVIYIELEEYFKKQIPRNLLYQGAKEIQSAQTEDDVWTALVKNIFEITHYDRVMIYKFLNDGSGKVIAEKKQPDLESYMDLYYPESDIPKQARALYLVNYKRIFSNVHSKPVRVISKLPVIDLTHSTVRAMSPIHGVYIKNSGASSSFSTSIIVDNKLWGLVTCHSTLPKHIDLFNRIQAEICTLIAANAYFSFKSKVMIENEALFVAKTTALKVKLASYDNLKDSLLNNNDEILAISKADGFAVITEGEVIASGETPPVATIQNIEKWAAHELSDEFFSCPSFYADYQYVIPGLDATCCGVALKYLGKQKNTLLLWFRKEFRSHINWAGNPEKQVDDIEFFDRQIRSISPRASFQIYSEEIQGKCSHWSKKDLLELGKIHDVILEVLQVQLDKVHQLNMDLKKLNEDLDSFSHTISHDLATPLSVIKLNVQMLDRNHDPEWQKNKIANILAELDNMSSMMKNVLELSRIKHSAYHMEEVPTCQIIEKICSDAMVSYETQTNITVSSTPNIWGEKTLVYQVFQNLITNAVKYSSQKENPQVIIKGEVHEHNITYCIIDNGIGIPDDEREKVFKIFSRMGNASAFSGTGVGLNIVHRIMDKLGGSVDFKSKVNEGTTFFLRFKKPNTNP